MLLRDGSLTTGAFTSRLCARHAFGCAQNPCPVPPPASERPSELATAGARLARARAALGSAPRRACERDLCPELWFSEESGEQARDAGFPPTPRAAGVVRGIWGRGPAVLIVTSPPETLTHS